MLIGVVRVNYMVKVRTDAILKKTVNIKVIPGYSHCDFENGIFDVMPTMFV